MQRAAAPVFISLGLAVSSLLMFAWLAHEVDRGDADKFDTYTRQAVHSLASPGMTKVMSQATKLGSWTVLIVFLIIFELIFLILKWRSAVIWLLVAMAGSFVLDQSLKMVFHRSRPDPFFAWIRLT